MKFKIKKERFIIEPTNEGQNLNYSETFKGDYEQARKRAEIMKTKLKKALPQGEIGVNILNEEAENVGSI
jgi:hypothetical protein